MGCVLVSTGQKEQPRTHACSHRRVSSGVETAARKVTTYVRGLSQSTSASTVSLQGEQEVFATFQVLPLCRTRVKRHRCTRWEPLQMTWCLLSAPTPVLPFLLFPHS